jgi:predicted site-specific integrase-resolvase
MSEPEPFRTVKQAAAITSIPTWKIYRALKVGDIPTYKLLNSRRYVKISDIQRASEQKQEAQNVA